MSEADARTTMGVVAASTLTVINVAASTLTVINVAAIAGIDVMQFILNNDDKVLELDNNDRIIMVTE